MKQATKMGVLWRLLAVLILLISVAITSLPVKAATTDLELSINLETVDIAVGATVDHLLTVDNNDADATGVVVNVTLPDGLVYLTNSTSQGSCLYYSHELTCSLGDVDNGNSASVRVTLVAPSTGTYTTSASVTSNETDSDFSDNRVSSDVTVAHAPAGTCYSVADAGDRLVTIDLSGPSSVAAPNGAGVPDIEAIAYWGGQLFAADAEMLGIIDVNTGLFSAIGPAGTGNGSKGSITFTDLDSLSFDPFTKNLYAVHRRSTNNVDDVLLLLDPMTGAFVPDAFGPGIDYVEIPAVSTGLDDVDDIAISSVDGIMFAVQNNGGSTDRMITVNKTTGASADVAAFTDGTNNVNDMEGLGYDINGVFYGTTGNSSTPDSNDDIFWIIDAGTGVATNTADLGAHGGDYESSDCLVGDINTIVGTVYHDYAGDGVMNSADSGTTGVAVNLYLDVNGNSVRDAGDILMDTKYTDPEDENGNFFFTVAVADNFVIEIDTGDLPTGHTLTTDNVEVAQFATTGNVVYGKDFGHRDAGTASIGDFVWFDADGDGMQDGGEIGLFGVTVELYTAGGSLVGTTTTDESGYYSFGDVAAGDYYLVFEQPDGYSFTTQDAAGDSVDSDVNAGGQTTTFTLVTGSSPGWDAGLVSTNMDFGDLPATYTRTRLGHDGARHDLGTLTLGANVDVEGDGQENLMAIGDTNDDGINRVGGQEWTNGATVDINIDLQGSTGNGQSDVGVWIDFDGDNDFAPDEFFAFPGLTVGIVNTVQITVPDAGRYTVSNPVNVRVRAFDPATLIGGSLDESDVIGYAVNGEVEDYRWEFDPNAVQLSSLAGSSLNVMVMSMLSLGAVGLVLSRKRKA